MKKLACVSAAILALGTSAGVAQSSDGNVRIKPGQVCAYNKCMRFTGDLSSVNVQGRRNVSVKGYRLAARPVVSRATFNEIFSLALRQAGRGVDR